MAGGHQQGSGRRMQNDKCQMPSAECQVLAVSSALRRSSTGSGPVFDPEAQTRRERSRRQTEGSEVERSNIGP